MKTILTDSENENENENENDNENKNENNHNNNENENENENKIKNLNNHWDKIIDKSKSFEDQIKSFKKVENLNQCWTFNDYNNKEIKFKKFKLKLAILSNRIDEKMFEQILVIYLQINISK